MSDWKSYLDQEQPRFVEEFLDFCRIPSISSLPEHAAGRAPRRRAGSPTASRAAGLEHVEVLETGGHPMVYADHLHAPGKPTVLIYGHFDTQPVDPLALWDADPFDPQVKDGRVYARGASDDKGGMFAPILAVEALLKTEGALPVNVKFFFEGQEEIGSPTMGPFVAANRERFACDLVVSADGGQWAEDQPSLALAFKGLCAVQIDVKGAYRDLHSGMYGGAVANPIHALAHILATMRAADGTILIDGFFDDVRDLTADDRARIAAVDFDEARYMRDLKVDALYGEPGYSTLERAWARPTLEVNGIWGGFQGEGVKTVLPNEAHAKITCRLVANQVPGDDRRRDRGARAQGRPARRARLGAEAPAERDAVRDAVRPPGQRRRGGGASPALRQGAVLRPRRREHPGGGDVPRGARRVHGRLRLRPRRRERARAERVLPAVEPAARAGGVRAAAPRAGDPGVATARRVPTRSPPPPPPAAWRRASASTPTGSSASAPSRARCSRSRARLARRSSR